MPKVSIIIPVYNAENFIKRCLDSIVNQTFKDIEIICINDGSKDNSLSILKEYQIKDSRIIIIDKENAGVSAARNDGIRKSKGEYITFVDADDWLELDALERVYDKIIEKNVDVVNFTCYVSKGVENTIKSMCGLEDKIFNTNQKEFVENVNIRILNEELFCAVWLLMIKRECLLSTSLFVEGIHYAEDCILYNELLDKIETIYFYDVPVYYYYINESSCTQSSKHFVKNIYSSAKAYEKIIEVINEDKFDKKEERKKVIANRFGKLTMGMLFRIYLDWETSPKEFLKILKDMTANGNLHDIVKNTYTSNLSLHMEIPFKLFAKKKCKSLLYFYSFRKFCRGVKEKRRKNK